MKKNEVRAADVGVPEDKIRKIPEFNDSYENKPFVVQMEGEKNLLSRVNPSPPTDSADASAHYSTDKVAAAQKIGTV